MYNGPGKYTHHTGTEAAPKVYDVYGLALNMDEPKGVEVVLYSRPGENGATLWFTRSLASFNKAAFHPANASDPDGEVAPKFVRM